MTALSVLQFADVVQRARIQGDYQALMSSIPYAGVIGAEVSLQEGELLFRLPQNPDNIGNPLLPAIHGGVIGGFMELAASIQVLVRSEPMGLPKMIDFSLDYLRAGRDQDTFVDCQIWRQGARVANVAITAWQNDRQQPIATARAHFLLSSSFGDEGLSAQ
ncbi:PaaI family thioesterase [Oceanobacter antarcticus]|uniref:PaaI family thioesterase n=1 Tax=Oceanobacter antarcticus TaxID=3133425 RepID=A0ABW8NG12_9GAMM